METRFIQTIRNNMSFFEGQTHRSLEKRIKLSEDNVSFCLEYEQSFFKPGKLTFYNIWPPTDDTEKIIIECIKLHKDELKQLFDARSITVHDYDTLHSDSKGKFFI